MHRVKLGDKIRVLVNGAEAAKVAEGDLLEVVELTDLVEDGEFIAKDERGETWYFANHTFDNKEIELVDSPQVIKQIEPETVKENKVKLIVNYHVLNDSIVLNYGGKTQNVASDDSRYARVLECIRNKTPELIPEIVEVERAFEGTGLELRDGLLYDGEMPFPSELNARILKFKDAGLPYDSLVAFWKNLKVNPSFNARKMMFAFLEHNGIPLTQDGCFIAYRGVTEDFKDKHTKTFNNSPGAICEMPRDAVDDNPNNTCSSGLHVACYEYAKDFAAGGKLVEVKVNPMDVVAVPTDYNGTKMRVCKFEVVQECAALIDKLVYDEPKEEPTLGDAIEEEEEEREEGVCPECNHENDWGANFCSECGTSLDNE